MQRQIFYFEKIKFSEIIIMAMYVVISFELWFFTKEAKSETQNDVIFWFAITTQMLLYGLNYKSLRNLKVYFFWLFIGLIHLFLYFLLQENANLICFYNQKITVLRNTIILLILFQFLRFISLRTQNLELVSIGGRYSNSKTDIFDNRKITRIDTLLYTIYIGATFLLICL